MCTDLEQASRQNFYFGAKLVRGAYILQERERAAALGYEDPTNPNFDATSEMYHKTLTECLRRIKKIKDAGQDPTKIAIMVASHNEDTGELLNDWQLWDSEQLQTFSFTSSFRNPKDAGNWDLTGRQSYLLRSAAWNVRLYHDAIGWVKRMISSNGSQQSSQYSQVKQDIRLTNIFHTVQLTRSFHICHDVLKRIKVFWRRFRKRRGFCSARSSDE